jgi:hypothetical protein
MLEIDHPKEWMQLHILLIKHWFLSRKRKQPPDEDITMCTVDSMLEDQFF